MLTTYSVGDRDIGPAVISCKANICLIRRPIEQVTLQDAPPPGRFALVRYARWIPNKGPSDVAIFFTAFGTFSWEQVDGKPESFKHEFWLRFGATSTYFRFLPYIKQNFDYGVVIFVLTFNLIAISSYQVRSVLKIARDRFYTIAIGCVVCLIMSVIVFPNWSGEDLHNSTVNRLERLAKSIED
ncbi:hypothetical protein AgCh_028410 [Apium graveolens]